ncbi:hypothetical protein [Corynebacterium variabile]|nr:hypothetical protein [Corynebacterium variabile]
MVRPRFRGRWPRHLDPGTHNPEADTLTEHGRHLAGVLRGIARILNPPPDD